MSAEAEEIVSPRWWHYEMLPSGEPYDWGGAVRGDHPDDQLDFHLDLGCGRLKGRLGIDHMADDGVDIVMDLNTLHIAGYGDDAWARATKLDREQGEVGPEDSGNPARGLLVMTGRLPFPQDSIESIITHHCFEHIGDGFIRLVDECHRVLRPGGILRIIVPLFPSHTAMADPDHCRVFMEETFNPFCGDEEGNSWMESFSTPYSTARFLLTSEDYTERAEDPSRWWTKDDRREMRVTLKKQ
jgi:SAM-dependent methyltransferase